MKKSTRVLSILFLIFLIGNQFDYLKAADSLFNKRREMVETQIKKRGVKDKAALKAMLSVPRHKFVPPAHRAYAYADRPLPIGHGQTISQPYIVALMTSLLNLDSESVVLEVGTGSGYQAAILSGICKEVYTVEIIPTLGKNAAALLKGLKYGNIKVRIGDGYYGWEEYAPFDGIMVTAAATYIPPSLIKQLKPGGKMIIPIGGVFQVQRLMLITKKQDGSLTSENIIPVRFVPLTRTD